MAIQPISLPPTAITGVDAALLRPGRVEPVDASARTQTDVRALGSNQAVVIQFGARALGLARSTLTPNLAVTTPAPLDTDETTEASSPSADDDLGGLLASAFGQNETDAALLGALGSNAKQARLLTPGAFEPESGLFGYRGQTPRESGIFRAPAAPSAESLLGGQDLDSSLESAFPRAAASDALSTFPRALESDAPESAFPQSPANDALASTFPRELSLSTESDFLFPPPIGTGASGVFGLSNATTESTFPGTNAFESAIDSTFPRAPTDAADVDRAATNPRSEPGPAAPNAERELRTLERNELQVRADERAQRAAAGGYADGARLRYEVGPDGRRYVVGSELSFDVTPVPGDPAATLRKMEAISRAASSGSPSISARTSAAEAEQLARQARAQLAAERYAEAQQF